MGAPTVGEKTQPQQVAVPSSPAGVDLSNIVKVAPKVSADGLTEPTHDVLKVGALGPEGGPRIPEGQGRGGVLHEGGQGTGVVGCGLAGQSRAMGAEPGRGRCQPCCLRLPHVPTVEPTSEGGTAFWGTWVRGL